jgi:hypothetical protein
MSTDHLHGLVPGFTDDGLGPYKHCEQGVSHCLDQNCGCVNSGGYRRAYRAARIARGWTAPPRQLRNYYAPILLVLTLIWGVIYFLL